MKNNYNFNGTNMMLVLMTFLLSVSGSAQRNEIWQQVDLGTINKENIKFQENQPSQYLLFNLQLYAFKQALTDIPSRINSSFNQGIIMSFPNSIGKIEDFNVLEASVMEDQLQQRFPNIRSFVGKSVNNPNTIIRFSVTPYGFESIIISGNGVNYIEAVNSEKTLYAVYSRKDAIIESFNCEFNNDEYDLEEISEFQRNADDGLLRNFRMGLACTEEYANFHIAQAGVGGGTDEEKKTAILAEMNDVMTRVNAVYERDLSVTMTLVANNDLIIFLESPFLDNDDYPILIDQSDQFIDAFLGASSYDIGHMLTTGPGGLAQLNSVCTTNKGRGVSGTSSPMGNGFEGILMHEIGHQFGSPHTFNGNAGSCNGNRSPSSAYEPGSGSTIMGYAGICSSQNVQNQRDLYFHQRSLELMWSGINSISNCATTTPSGNSAPTAEAGESYTIPIGTPFKLTGSSTDTDGIGSHTYAWEQYDLGPAGVPTGGNVDGPLVRSFFPSESPVRYIPRLEDVVNNGGQSTAWEKLPFVDREINFILTVRDNDPSGGQIAVDNMVVNSIATGIFNVISQGSTGIVYEGNSTQTVEWNVAGTTGSGIDTANVNILLSTDGGLNFDTVLASNTPNDGSEDVIMPNIDSTNCRIIVEAVGNIFYNINLNEFEIEAQLSVNENSLSNLSIYPNPVSNALTIKFNTSVQDVDITLYDIRGRKVYKKFVPNSIEISETISVENMASGIYILRISNDVKSIERKVVVK